MLNNDLFKLLAFTLDAQTHKTTIKLTIASSRKTYNQTGWDWFCMGNRTNSTQQVKYVGTTDAFYFGFYSMSPKWTRTKIVIEIALFLQAYSCLLLVQAVYRFQQIGSENLIEIGLFLVAHSNENPFHHVLVCIFMI